MKRKTIALMTAFTLVMSLSACGEKTPVSTEMTDTTSGPMSILWTQKVESLC